MLRILSKRKASILPVFRKTQTTVIPKSHFSSYGSFPKPFPAAVKYAFRLLGATTVAGVTLYVIHSNDKNTVHGASDERKKKLVILGSGWGAVSIIKNLKPDLYDITVVSPTNYFLFTPLLPSVTVGTVDGRSLTEPIRKILNRRQKENIEYFEAACVDVDVENNQILCLDKSDIVGDNSEFKLDYDILVVAVGSKTATYNNPDIEKYAHKLKNVNQAQEIRKNIIDVLESAALPGQTEEEIKRMLNFCVVGGGPTGVEFAGELRDYLHDLKKLYPKRICDMISITLINSHYKILSMYDEQISQFAENKFKSDGITTIGGSYVVGMDPKNIEIKNKATKEITKLPYGICVWAAGIAPRDITKTLIKKIPNQKNRNALVTDGFLKVKNSDNIFGIGDCATVEFTKLIGQVEELFKHADVDGSGELSLSEFSGFLEKAKKSYPEMTHHLNKLHRYVETTFSKMDTNKDDKLSFEEFATFLEQTDNKLKSYPATAQVASQQGKYLASLLSKHPEEVTDKDFTKCEAFQYKHLGSFAYVGGEKAVLELPIIGAVNNFATIWLWRGAYLNQAVSVRMETLIALDWLKAHTFGRDTSRI